MKTSGRIKIIVEVNDDEDGANDVVSYVNTQEEVISFLISHLSQISGDRVRLIHQGSGPLPRWMRFYRQ